MRILISTRKGAGHFGPLVPFAKALLRDNHEILVTAPRSATPMIAAAGMDHHPIPDPPEEQRAPIVANTAGLSPDERNARMVGDVFIRIDSRAAYPHVLGAVAELAPGSRPVRGDPRTPRRWRRRPPACPPSAWGSPRAPSGSSSGRRSRPRSTTCAPTSASRRIRSSSAFTTMPFFTLAPPSLEDPGTPGPDGRPALPRDRRRHAAPAPRLVDRRQPAARLPDVRLGRADDELLPRRLPRRDRRAGASCRCACSSPSAAIATRASSGRWRPTSTRRAGCRRPT